MYYPAFEPGYFGIILRWTHCMWGSFQRFCPISSVVCNVLNLNVDQMQNGRRQRREGKAQRMLEGFGFATFKLNNRGRKGCLGLTSLLFNVRGRKFKNVVWFWTKFPLLFQTEEFHWPSCTFLFSSKPKLFQYPPRSFDWTLEKIILPNKNKHHWCLDEIKSIRKKVWPGPKRTID